MTEGVNAPKHAYSRSTRTGSSSPVIPTSPRLSSSPDSPTIFGDEMRLLLTFSPPPDSPTPVFYAVASPLPPPPPLLDLLLLRDAVEKIVSVDFLAA